MAGGNAYDAADDLISLINDNWSLSHPIKVRKMWDQKSIGFGEDRFDSIMIFPKNEKIDYFGLYGSDFLHTVEIKVHVRSYQGHEHHNDLVNEFQRIIKENIRRTGYVDLLIKISISESEPLRNMFRHTFSVQYRKLNP